MKDIEKICKFCLHRALDIYHQPCSSNTSRIIKNKNDSCYRFFTFKTPESIRKSKISYLLN